MDIAADKKRLRALALERRSAMGSGQRAQAAERAACKARDALCSALPALRPLAGRTLSLFAPFRDEIDTAPLAALLRAAGARLALPVILGRDRPLLFRLWEEGAPLVPTGAFRIPEPGPEAPEVVPDTLLVPLAAFDRRGFRVGYGAGFYDRTLALLRAGGPVLALGYAFACQEVDHVPAEAHDEPVDMMITEAEAWATRPLP